MPKDGITPKRKIVVLGVGGHGSSAYIDLLTNPEYADCEIHLVMGVDDSGGHTGGLLRTLDYMFHFDPEYMNGIGFSETKDLYKMLPMGDFRANLIRILHSSDDAQGLDRLLDYRYEGFEKAEFIDLIKNLCITLGFDDALSQRFVEFCEVYFRNFLKFSDEISKGKSSHSIGNMLLTFLYIEDKFNSETFVEHLRMLQILPERIVPHFLSETRLTLYAKDNAERFILGEHVVDSLGIAISPNDYRLADLSEEDEPLAFGVTTDETTKQKLDSHKINGDDIPVELRDLINNADLIMLSTGSIANLLPQLNLFADTLRKSDAPIIWLGNIFKGANEVDFEVLAVFFYQTLGLNGFILQMDETDSKNIRLLEMYLEKYQEQFKTPVNIKLLLKILEKDFNRNGYLAKKRMLLPVLHVRDAKKLKLDRDHAELREVLEQNGIKYIPEEITAYALFISELSIYFEHDAGILEMNERYLKMIDIIEMIDFETRESDELIAELTSYRKLLQDNSVDSEAKYEMLVQEIVMNNTSVREHFEIRADS